VPVRRAAAAAPRSTAAQPRGSAAPGACSRHLRRAARSRPDASYGWHVPCGGRPGWLRGGTFRRRSSHRSRPNLARLHERYLPLEDGEVACYIPELAKADPRWFGIAIATTDGHVYEVGESRVPFTIQSISKPFTYGLALADQGREAVLARIGVEPSGEAFNAISLSPDGGQPLNPMINAGAIAAASLVAGRSDGDRLERLLAVYSTYAGRPLEIDRAVFESERATGHRNPRSATCSATSRSWTASPSPRSTSTSGSARSRSSAATSPSWPGRSRTAA